MDTVINILHIVTAVFIVGPMAIIPMTALRALRGGHAAQAASLAKSTRVFSLLSLLTVVFGFGAMSLAPERYDLSITTPWILWSLVLYAVALVLSLFVVAPAIAAAAGSTSTSTSTAGGSSPAGYGRIAGGSGVATLLLVAVTVLMVWKP
ncbi:MAG: DUF2269 family protein [Microbacteriaceae bacterium]